MGMCEISAFPIFTFSSVNDTKFCTGYYTKSLYLVMDSKISKMMTSNFTSLLTRVCRFALHLRYPFKASLDSFASS